MRTAWCLTTLLLVACSGGDPIDPEGVDAGPEDSAAAVDADADAGPADADPADLGPVDLGPDAGPAPCDEVDAFGPGFQSTIDRWSAQDQNGGWPARPTVFVGSSSIRRWETLARDYSGYAPLQRGFGGSQLADVAKFAQALIIRHDPRAVVVFAGTNDVAAGVDADTVVERFRCLRHRVGVGLGWDRPIVFIAITPTPSRWASWAESDAVNQGVAAIAAEDPAVFYADVATPFLATGEPPDRFLFVQDQLHLNPDGYTLWSDAIRPVVEMATAVSPAAGTPSRSLAPGARVLVDLGPTNPEDGEITPSPDYLGQHWNNWHDVLGDAQILAGEQLVDLVTSTGEATDIDLVVAGGFRGNGRSNGGLLWPEQSHLGDLAVGSATGDFFFVDGADNPGALQLRGLDPARTYTIRLFAAREDSQRRITRYTLIGDGQWQDSLQTTGEGAGTDMTTTNDDTVLSFTGVAPDRWGHLYVDVEIEAGRYAYLSLLEIVGE